MNVLVFDIETVPDIEGARKIWELDGLSDTDIFSVMCNKRLQETDGKSDFIRHHLQKVVAISVAIRNGDRFQVWSLGEESSSEADLIGRFFNGLERYAPTLVSWNGSGFDLPVLHYRALLNKVVAPAYWEDGSEDRNFRYNNYLSRYHSRHLDLMDVLAAYQPRAYVSLDEMATMMGYPGKYGISGADVYGKFLQGELAAIRDYCESDVLNTWLVFLQFELMRGRIDEKRFQKEIEVTKQFLQTVDQPHLTEFLKIWNAAT